MTTTGLPAAAAVSAGDCTPEPEHTPAPEPGGEAEPDYPDDPVGEIVPFGAGDQGDGYTVVPVQPDAADDPCATPTTTPTVDADPADPGADRGQDEVDETGDDDETGDPDETVLDDGGRLANTGASAATTGAVGALLLAAGTTAVLAARPRRGEVG